MTDFILFLILVGTYMFSALFLRDWVASSGKDERGELRLPSLKSALIFLIMVIVSAMIAGFFAELVVATLDYNVGLGAVLAIAIGFSGMIGGQVFFEHLAKYHTFTKSELDARQQVATRKRVVG